MNQPINKEGPLSDQRAPQPATHVQEVENNWAPFHPTGGETLGILGGKGVGKSYLFRAMVYRLSSSRSAGSMSRFVNGIELDHRIQPNDKAKRVLLSDFLRSYSNWIRLGSTLVGDQSWYNLKLIYRSGLFRRMHSIMDVEFFEGSGEGFFEATRTIELIRLWREGYLNARVVVFCLPIWVAFPGLGLHASDWQSRNEMLEGFERVVQNYKELTRESDRRHRVRSILVLTMADDRRSALKTLLERWIAPYMDAPHTYLRALRSGRGVAQYLAEAQRISAALLKELSASSDPRVSAIPQTLDFGARPWVVPTSAIEGEQLDRIEREHGHSSARLYRPAPVPVHVELPLLVALCERTNALM